MFEIQKFPNSLRLMLDLKKITKIEDLSFVIFYLKSYKKKLLKNKNKKRQTNDFIFFLFFLIIFIINY